jgi:hypothetical protein
VLLALALCLSQVPAVEHPPYERMSLQELRDEQRSIENARPSLMAPIFMISSGGVLMGTGSLFGLAALGGVFGGATLGNAMVVLGFILGGAGCLVGGLVFMRSVRAERATYDDDLDVIQHEMELRHGYSARQRMPLVTVAAF